MLNKETKLAPSLAAFKKSMLKVDFIFTFSSVMLFYFYLIAHCNSLFFYSYKNFTTNLTFYKTSLITLQHYGDDTMGSERQ